MHKWLIFPALVLCFVVTGNAGDPKSAPAEKILFDFEDSLDLKVWSNLEQPDAKEKEPRAKLAFATDHATSGKHSLKITFAGGRWPTITTTQILDDWLSWSNDFDVHGRTVNLARNRKFETDRRIVDRSR